MEEKTWVEKSRVKDKPANSLTVMLKTRGCSYAKRKGSCSFCAFYGFAEKNPLGLGPEKLTSRLVAALSNHKLEEEGISELKLYNGGSFFANEEVWHTEREAMLCAIAKYGFRKLLVEARPEHISAWKIREATVSLGNSELEVAMGLETANDALRERLRKGFTRADFNRAAATLARFGVTTGAYILVKPVPMSEEEAKADALGSLEYLAALRARLGVRVSARLQAFTLYEGMSPEPGHVPVSLSTLMDIIKKAPDNLDMFIGWNEGEAVLSAVDSGVVTELRQIRDKIERFNSTGDRKIFEGS
jgi:hypothetical protein